MTPTVSQAEALNYVMVQVANSVQYMLPYIAFLGAATFLLSWLLYAVVGIHRNVR